ncbi:response regulator [Echinicola sediminis]
MENEILLIDDDEVTNFVHRRLILKESPLATITIAENGKKGWDYIYQSQFRKFTVFLDLNMPVMDGWGFLDTLQSNARTLTSSVEVIILTSSIDRTEIKRAKMYEQVSAYIHKPLQKKHLQDLIAVW